MSQYGAGCVWNTGTGRCNMDSSVNTDDDLCYMGPQKNCRRRPQVARPAMAMTQPRAKTMRKACPAGKVRNPQTGRCVTIGGPIHRKLMESEQQLGGAWGGARGGAKSQPGCHMSPKKRCAGYNGPDADGCVKGPDERCRSSTGLRRAYNVKKPASEKQLAALAKARAVRASHRALQKGGW